MKKDDKKNGFTLVELLSVVVILGIITTIVVVSYNRYIIKTNNTYYNSLSDIFKTAVIDYYSDNPSQLPDNIGDRETVESQLLLNKNYLESFIDTDKNLCEGKGISYKKATGKYEYSTCIRCPGYKDNAWYGDGCGLNIENRDYEIIRNDLEYSQGKDASGNFGNTIIHVPDAIVKVKDKTLNISLSPKPSTIDTKVPHNTEYTVYYQYQNEYIEKKIKIVDDTKPTIIVSAKLKDTNTNYTSETWTNKDVTVTVKSSDWTISNELLGSGVKKIQMSSDGGSSWSDISFSVSGNVATATTNISTQGKKTYHFRVVDKAGNKSEEAIYKIYIDKEAPSFVSGYPKINSSISSYNSKNPVVTLKATDNIGVTQMCVSTTSYTGCTWEEYKNTINWGDLREHLDGYTATFYISVKDIAGNVVKTTKTYTLTTSGIDCGTYAKKASVSYAGLNWYVLSDNGDNTTLILKTNSNKAQTYGTSTAWSGSNAQSKVTSWFNDNSKLVLDQTTEYIINNSTYGIVRIPTKDEANGIVNDSNTPYWTLTSNGSNMWYAKKDGTFSYNSYTSSKGGFACYYGYKESSIDSMKKYNYSISSAIANNTVASPNSSSNYIDWTYDPKTNPCATHVTDSSGMGPETGHSGSGPFADKGPFCADIAPYYGDCGTGSNFCPSSSNNTSKCNATYITYTINKNKENMGLRPVIQVKERCKRP